MTNTINDRDLPLPADIAENLENAVAIRRAIHNEPEIGLDTVKTAEKAVAELRRIGCDEIVGNLGGAGVVGLIRGRGLPEDARRPRIGLRGDTDALPLVEATGCAYTSGFEGVMHACGHDGHTAGILLAGAALAARRDRLMGDVLLILQPGEEGFAGARRMIEDGMLERFPLDEIYGAHGAADLPVGTFGFTKGFMQASADHIFITVKGKGGHGARPHTVVDPIVAAGTLIVALQTVVSRSINPMHPAVVSLGSIQGGDPVGVSVVPETVKLTGTTRCASPEDQDVLERRIGEICAGVGAATGAEIMVEYRRVYPPLLNHEAQTDAAVAIAREFFGDEAVCDNMPGAMGAEDFSFFLQKVPGCYLRAGLRDAQHTSNLHAPTFDYNDRTLGPTAALLAEIAEKRLEALAKGAC